MLYLNLSTLLTYGLAGVGIYHLAWEWRFRAELRYMGGCHSLFNSKASYLWAITWRFLLVLLVVILLLGTLTYLSKQALEG